MVLWGYGLILTMKTGKKLDTGKSFDDARIFARSLKLTGKEQWIEYRRSGKKPKDIPSHPDTIYKRTK